MYKKIKLFLAATVLTVLVFSCEKAMDAPDENINQLIESSEKAAIMIPPLMAYYEPICWGYEPTVYVDPKYRIYNTLQVTFGIELHHYLDDRPFTYRVYEVVNNEYNLVKTYTSYNTNGAKLTGLRNNTKYQVTVTTSVGYQTVIVGSPEYAYPESYATTLSCDKG